MAGGRRLAMWSGPRNISTAMMRAWENRADTEVVDEPLYAYYLRATGLDHPAREEVLASQPDDWRTVVDELLREPGPGRIFYQKHMTHHVLDEVELDWLDQLDHCFLIREPDEVVRSYAAVREEPTVDDLGFRQQARIFERVHQRTGVVPCVIEARTVLEDPRAALTAVCARLGLPFDEAMLAWPAGPRDSDGVWAPHWYASVEASTGFAPYRPREGTLPAPLQAVADACRPWFERLRPHALTPDL